MPGAVDGTLDPATDSPGPSVRYAAAAALVAEVRASAIRAASTSLDQLVTELPAPIESMSLGYWPLDFPDDIAVRRRAPHDSRADSVM